MNRYNFKDVNYYEICIKEPRKALKFFKMCATENDYYKINSIDDDKIVLLLKNYPGVRGCIENVINTDYLELFIFCEIIKNEDLPTKQIINCLLFEPYMDFAVEIEISLNDEYNELVQINNGMIFDRNIEEIDFEERDIKFVVPSYLRGFNKHNIGGKMMFANDINTNFCNIMILINTDS